HAAPIDPVVPPQGGVRASVAYVGTRRVQPVLQHVRIEEVSLNVICLVDLPDGVGVAVVGRIERGECHGIEWYCHPCDCTWSCARVSGPSQRGGWDFELRKPDSAFGIAIRIADDRTVDDL